LQNNNRGGYNVGDLTQNPAGNNANLQYQMVSMSKIFIDSTSLFSFTILLDSLGCTNSYIWFYCSTNKTVTK